MKISISRYDMFDVAVVGGGMAGIAAAIAAGRMGAKTVLIEKGGWLGGIGVVGATGLHSFFNIFQIFKEAGRLRVARGIAQELVDRVCKLGGGLVGDTGPGHILMERGGDFVSMLTPVEPEVFKLAAFQLCEEAGVRLLLHTVMDDVWADGGFVEAVVVWNKAGRSLIRANQFVDCTGDGDLAAYAGAPFRTFAPGDEGAYSAGFTFRLVNVDLQAMAADLDRRGLITQLAHAIKPGMSQPDLVRLGIDMHYFRKLGVPGAPEYFLSSSLRPREITYCNCINYGPNDGLDPEALTRAESNLRKRIFETADFFRNNVSGCEFCYPAGPAPFAGQRRGRAIRCEYELTVSDCTDGKQFEDQIGCFSFIDNPRDRVKEGGAYGIPYQALIPIGIENALVAGRMISIDLTAHNSTRNTVSCLIQGQAAGTAAAMASKSKQSLRQLDTSYLQHILNQTGALIKPQIVKSPT